jgi:hypothetical protein
MGAASKVSGINCFIDWESNSASAGKVAFIPRPQKFKNVSDCNIC